MWWRFQESVDGQRVKKLKKPFQQIPKHFPTKLLWAQFRCQNMSIIFVSSFHFGFKKSQKASRKSRSDEAIETIE